MPTLIHHAAEGDRVITECGAIAAYLAQGTALAPTPEESAAYYRWLFFATGPLEQAIVAQAMGWEVPPKR
ncbi:hypothetical protein ACFS32_06895 [Novosphingobium pokkalii]|uniref:hypothetical protein n=1 Tax=Novosphingobium pokkalii TaxID=1770194 RepID=UPI003630CB75